VEHHLDVIRVPRPISVKHEPDATKVPRSTEDPILSDIRRAAQQIDQKRGGALAWLTEFVRQAPKTWLDGEAAAHGLRLLAIANPATLAPNVVRLARDMAPLGREEVEAMHRELREFLTRAVSAPAGEAITVPGDDGREALVRATAPGVKPAIYGTTRGGSVRTMLFEQVKRMILQPDGARLVACKQCEQPTLALRRRLFCSQECTGAWHDAQKAKARKANGGGPR
jgi:hypothetical protein